MVVCAGCERPILDRFLLNVLDRAWHAKCVQCSDCKAALTDKCFSRDGKLYCRDDFFRRFGTKCGGCSQGISPNDLVRRARNKVFHLKCFTCMVCRKQLSTGEELYVLDENKFICKEDYLTSKLADTDHEDGDGDMDTPMMEKMEDGLSEKELTMSMDGDMDDSRDSMLPNAAAVANNPAAALPALVNGTGTPGVGHTPTGNPLLVNTLNRPSPKSQASTPTPEVKLEQNNNITTTNNNIRDTPSVDNSGSGSGSENEENKSSDKIDGEKSGNPPGAKRRGPRTTIKAKQLEVLKAAFNATPKPTRHIREQLAQETGLNMRVIQVWFQNRRSKERRMKQLSALGARRHFFRNPRMRRSLRPGEIDDMADVMGQPGFNYPFTENGDFYPGYPGYGEYFPGQGDPAGMNFLPPPGGPGGPLVDQNVHPAAYELHGVMYDEESSKARIKYESLGQDGQYMHGDMLPRNGSPDPSLPPMSHPDFVHGPPRSLPSGFGPAGGLTHGGHEMAGEAW